jgi:hypothetical protein
VLLVVVVGWESPTRLRDEAEIETPHRSVMWIPEPER